MWHAAGPWRCATIWDEVLDAEGSEIGRQGMLACEIDKGQVAGGPRESNFSIQRML
jgi:hypothetical protein